ncbi:MAG: hypothetical protein ISR85_03080 [Kiritimatiellales bacterium]|nr:hypothetical protein [Kiritimatiellota bacterium]MBL7011897.1 hypothetical protein [Kiritimatiellales bacterium]
MTLEIRIDKIGTQPAQLHRVTWVETVRPASDHTKAAKGGTGSGNKKFENPGGEKTPDKKTPNLNQTSNSPEVKPGDKFSILKPKNEPYCTGLKNSKVPFLNDKSLLMQIVANLPFVHEISQWHDARMDTHPAGTLEWDATNVPEMAVATVQTAVAGVGAAVGSIPVPEMTNGGLKWEY